MAKIGPIARQVAALPLRRSKRGPEILLITSRETNRWIIPKGWASGRLNDREAAAREAWEEAGVKGRIVRRPLGAYHYIKRFPDREVAVEVRVFVLKVRKRFARWPEKRERRRAWVPIREAERMLSDPELAFLIGALCKRKKLKRARAI